MFSTDFRIKKTTTKNKMETELPVSTPLYILISPLILLCRIAPNLCCSLKKCPEIHANIQTWWNLLARAFSWLFLLPPPLPAKDVITLPSQEAGRKIYKIYLAKPVKLKWNRKCSQVANIMYSSRFYSFSCTYLCTYFTHTF